MNNQPTVEPVDHTDLIQRAEEWLENHKEVVPGWSSYRWQLIRDLLSAVKGK